MLILCFLDFLDPKTSKSAKKRKSKILMITKVLYAQYLEMFDQIYFLLHQVHIYDAHPFSLKISVCFIIFSKCVYLLPISQVCCMILFFAHCYILNLIFYCRIVIIQIEKKIKLI